MLKWGLGARSKPRRLTALANAAPVLLIASERVAEHWLRWATVPVGGAGPWIDRMNELCRDLLAIVNLARRDQETHSGG